MNTGGKRPGPRPRRPRSIEGHDAAGGPEALWQMRRALGRQLAALRNRAGLSQWEFAPLTGYSRSTLSDAELGRHRLRREFWQRCDELLKADGHLIRSYDRIETAAALMRQRARSAAQVTREQDASARLRAIPPLVPPAGAGEGRRGGAGTPGGTGGPGGAAGRVAAGRVGDGGHVPAAIDLVRDSGPAAPDPGTPGPGISDPGAAGPGIPGPGIPGPGIPAPGIPGFGRPASGRPASGSPGPGSLEPGGSSPDSADPGTPDPDGHPGSPVPVDVCPHCHRPIAVVIVPTAPAVANPRGW
jgi:transcriptional regulator with XRE-family HTH domain